MKIYTVHVYLLIVMMCTSLLGCSSNQDVSNIQVLTADPVIASGISEEFPLPNCGGSSEVAQSLGTQASVTKRVEIGTNATLRGSIEAGAPVVIANIPAIITGKLEGEIELAYKETFETAASRLDNIQIKAAPETNVVYIVQWEEQRFSSIVLYDSSGKTYEVPYTYIIKVPKLSDSYRRDCEGASLATVEVNSVTTSTISNTICGEAVTPESLSGCVGGNSAYWTSRGLDVWGYWDEGHKVTFRHPGGGAILTYWAGFPDPRNAQGCQIVIVQSEDTKYVKCDSAGAEFESDGIGFHLVDHTSVFK